MAERVLMKGNEAIAEAAVRAGCRDQARTRSEAWMTFWPTPRST